LELVCVDDKMRICSQCALFGQHKGHDVRMEDDVQKEISLKVEVIMEMYQAMSVMCEDLKETSAFDKHASAFKKRQQEMKE
jgi:uncharacterized protein YfbU (UPF0304 family)